MQWMEASALRACTLALPRKEKLLPICSPTESLSRVGLHHRRGPMQLEKQSHFLRLSAAGKHTRGTALARVWAAATLINLNYSVYTNKQAEAIDVAGAFNDLGHREMKKA